MELYIWSRDYRGLTWQDAACLQVNIHYKNSGDNSYRDSQFLLKTLSFWQVLENLKKYFVFSRKGEYDQMMISQGDWYTHCKQLDVFGLDDHQNRIYKANEF